MFNIEEPEICVCYLVKRHNHCSLYLDSKSINPDSLSRAKTSGNVRKIGINDLIECMKEIIKSIIYLQQEQLVSVVRQREGSCGLLVFWRHLYANTSLKLWWLKPL